MHLRHPALLLRSALLPAMLVPALLGAQPLRATALQPSGDPRFGVVEAWRAPAQAAAIGVRWERIAFWWKELQPTGPDSWNDFATGRDHFITGETDPLPVSRRILHVWLILFFGQRGPRTQGA